MSGPVGVSGFPTYNVVANYSSHIVGSSILAVSGYTAATSYYGIFVDTNAVLDTQIIASGMYYGVATNQGGKARIQPNSVITGNDAFGLYNTEWGFAEAKSCIFSGNGIGSGGAAYGTTGGTYDTTSSTFSLNYTTAQQGSGYASTPSLLSISPAANLNALGTYNPGNVQLAISGSGKNVAQLNFGSDNTGYSLTVNAQIGGVGAVPVVRFTDAGNMATFGTLNLVAGSSTVPPLVMASGTNLTTPSAGALEYDGHAPYFSPVAGVRGVVPAFQHSHVTASGGVTLANVNTAQSFLPSGAQNFPVEAGVIYRFRAKLLLNMNTTTTCIKNILFSGKWSGLLLDRLPLHYGTGIHTGGSNTPTEWHVAAQRRGLSA